jgi:hypothetical protein
MLHLVKSKTLGVVLLIKAVYKNINSEFKLAFYLRIRLSKNITIIAENFQIQV